MSVSEICALILTSAIALAVVGGVVAFVIDLWRS